MPQPQIKVKDLEITYNLGKENEYKATRGVSMDIYPGEYVAFFGPSGCGKSTLFYSILGILEPSAGELYVNGENPYTYSADRMVDFQTKTIGIIYQAFYLINSLDVIDNVALPQTFMGIPKDKRRRWAKHLLKRFGLEDTVDKFADNLSGGQMQRVSVARSLVNSPEIILADEPTGNLDSVSTKQVMDILEEINQKDKTTVVLITHNAAQLMYCHRVFYMKDGKLDRIVPNPEKKQIAKIDKQKTLVTEMDQLSKIYPYDTPTVLKVKSLVNYLTQGINIEQTIRLESVLKLKVERKISQAEFEKELLKDFGTGGVGLTKSVVEAMAERVKKILDYSEEVRRYRRRFKQNMFFLREERLINKLTKYVLAAYKGEITPFRLRKLKQAVRERISGVLRKEEFFERLMMGEKENGVGFSKSAAKKITDFFEKIIIQGVETKGKH